MIEEPIDQIQASGYVPVLFDPQFPTMLCYVNQRGNFFFFFLRQLLTLIIIKQNTVIFQTHQLLKKENPTLHYIALDLQNLEIKTW